MIEASYWSFLVNSGVLQRESCNSGEYTILQSSLENWYNFWRINAFLECSGETKNLWRKTHTLEYIYISGALWNYVMTLEHFGEFIFSLKHSREFIIL